MLLEEDSVLSGIHVCNNNCVIPVSYTDQTSSLLYLVVRFWLLPAHDLPELMFRDILTMLKNGRLNAGEIAEELQITPAALSYHLKLLKSADLVSEYKEKNFVYYEINTTVFDELIIWVNQFGGKKR